MENSPLVSVIVPIFNVENYLKECIESVLCQSYGNFELILVDDGSSDSSGRICDYYGDKYEKVSVIHKENGGLSDARNKGLEKAKGKYVYFLDGDDYILPDTLLKLTETAKKENADIVFFDAESFADSDDFKVSQNYKRKNVYKTDSGFAVFGRMQDNNEYHASVPLMFFCREFLEKNNLSFVTGIYYEDMVFTYQALCLAGCVAQRTESFYKRRYRKDSITTSVKNGKHFTGRRDVYFAVKEFSEKQGISDKEQAKRYIARCAFNALNIYNDLSAEDKKIYRNDYSELKKDILNNDGFGDKNLRARCRGSFFWFCGKVYDKTFGRIFGK